jgi:hypothetical protein
VADVLAQRRRAARAAEQAVQQGATVAGSAAPVPGAPAPVPAAPPTAQTQSQRNADWNAVYQRYMQPRH